MKHWTHSLAIVVGFALAATAGAHQTLTTKNARNTESRPRIRTPVGLEFPISS